MDYNGWADYDFRLEKHEQQASLVEIEDFALIGGVIGFIEEQVEEERRLEREMAGIDEDGTMDDDDLI